MQDSRPDPVTLSFIGVSVKGVKSPFDLCLIGLRDRIYELAIKDGV